MTSWRFALPLRSIRNICVNKMWNIFVTLLLPVKHMYFFLSSASNLTWDLLTGRI